MVASPQKNRDAGCVAAGKTAEQRGSAAEPKPQCSGGGEDLEAFSSMSYADYSKLDKEERDKLFQFVLIKSMISLRRRFDK